MQARCILESQLTHLKAALPRLQFFAQMQLNAIIGIGLLFFAFGGGGVGYIKELSCTSKFYLLLIRILRASCGCLYCI